MVTRQGVSDAVDIAIKVAVPVAIIGAGAYVIYKLANPSPDCTTPGSACYSAIQGYQTELNACAQQLADLSGQLITQGAAPTASQQFLMQQLLSCMNTASTNEANTAKGFQQPNLNDFITYAGEIALIVAVAYAAEKYALPGLATFINNLRSSGKLKTPATGGAGITTVIIDGFVQYAVAQGLITSAIASAWGSSLSAISGNDIADLGAFWPSLETLGLVSANVVSSEISLLTNTINEDLVSSYASLGLPPPPPLFQYAMAYETVPYQEAGCGCQ